MYTSFSRAKAQLCSSAPLLYVGCYGRCPEEEKKKRGSIEALKIPSDPDSTQQQILNPPKNDNPQKKGSTNETQPPKVSLVERNNLRKRANQRRGSIEALKIPSDPDSTQPKK
jgi:hypothetical protein